MSFNTAIRLNFNFNTDDLVVSIMPGNEPPAFPQYGTFGICHCSTFEPDDLATTQAPTEFLGKLYAAIDFSEVYSTSTLSTNYAFRNACPSDADASDIQLCLSFLVMCKDRGSTVYHKSLWNFILSFLQIDMDSSWDYLLMNYLEYRGYCDHGSGIRCAWASTSLDNYVVPDKHQHIITQWAEAPSLVKIEE